MDCAQLANVAASGLVALCSIVFAAMYQRHAPWRSTPVGRHIMSFTLAIGAFGAYTVAITFWDHGAPAAVLRAVRTLLLVVISALIIQRTQMVLRAQHAGALHDVGRDRPNPPAG
ncbi:hypothetical protein AB0933_32460 [Streptomyces venezuelae]|uniref:putative phage holin n=1 Tax=Streptomyces venezuelae TaxID=54571 RepID=UPI003453D604